MRSIGDISSRLRQERERLGISQEEMGSLAGVDRKTQGNYESGKRMPDVQYLSEVEGVGVDVLYVITGRREAEFAPIGQRPAEVSSPGQMSPVHGHPVRPDTTQASAPTSGGSRHEDLAVLLTSGADQSALPLRLPVLFGGGGAPTRREYQVIPRIRGAASAGVAGSSGNEALAIDLAGVLAMDRTWMRDQLGSDKPSFTTVAVKGDSMERTLIDGETIIIDRDVVEVDCNGIYVVQVGRALLVKRLILGLDGSVLVKSDNAAYSAYDKEFSAEQAMAVRVVGRMVWPRFR